MGQITATRNLVATKVVRLAGQSSATGLFAQQFVDANIKDNIKAPHCWPFTRIIHCSTMDSPHKVTSNAVIPPLHRGCDLCASLVRPQNWPGRRWRQKGGRTVALVVQGWHIGRSDIAMDAMVAVKFWACSKQSHKGHRGGRSLTGRSKEAGWRHTHRRGRRMDAQWSAIGRPIKNANIVYQFERHVCLPCTTIVPPLADQWRPLSDHCGDHWASIQRPRQHLSHHVNGSAFTLPSLRDLLCHYSSFGRSRKAQGSCCSSYTET